jgi:phage FluMu gp28-like protein
MEAQKTWPTPVSPETRRRVLAAYKSVLPENEWAAMRAWLHTFYPFQLEWLLDPARFAVCNKSRQIGMSHTTSGVVVLWAAMLGETTTLISIGQREADEVRDKAEKHAKALVALGSRWAQARSHGESLKFASGGRIIAVPSSSGGRSFSGNVFLDEFAYLEKPGEIWDAAAAVTLHDGKFRVGSTPNGVGNDFYNFWNQPKQNKGWNKHEFPLERAIAEGMRVSLDDCWKMAKGDPRIFDQLFNCKFLDGELQFIATEFIAAASVDDLYTFEGEYFGGLDIGRTVDRTRLVILRKLPEHSDRPGHRVLAWVAGCKRTDVEALEALVDWAFAVFKFRRFCVDASGLGSFEAERMQKRHGMLTVEPVTFTNPVKEDLATTLYSAFTQRSLSIAKTEQALKLPYDLPHEYADFAKRFAVPKAAEEVRTDVASIRREVTSAGNIRYDAPHTDEGHADTAWALALALHACGNTGAIKHEIAPRGQDEREGVYVVPSY